MLIYSKETSSSSNKHSTITMIDYQNVNVSFGKFQALYDVNFHLQKGSVLHIVGPNGSGKTTLVKTLVGLLKPSNGMITINAEHMGYLPQKLNSKTNMPMTVREVIYSGFRKQRIKPTKEECELIQKWLERMEISHLFTESMTHLSGGQQQRVYLIRALISKPDLLILDEPTSALDPSFREKFYLLLDEIHEQEKMTIVHVTHDLTDAVKENCYVMYVDQTIKFFGTYHDFHEFEHKGHHHA